MDPLIAIQNLSFTYPDGRTALQDVSLKIYPGEKIALVGANGAGKSTLLLHLNGVLDGTGRVVVNDLPAKKENLGRIRGWVGMVFQNPDDQLFSTTVYEDVAYGPLYQGLDQGTIRQRVEKALQDVGMAGMGERNPYHMSGGEKKRVAIATVLSMQPQVLVFDEPSAGLDPRARRELMRLLGGLPQTMIIATHDLGLARELTGRTILLDQGRIAADGPTLSILADEELMAAHGL